MIVRRNKGVTLIELLVTIALIGIIAGIAGPGFMSYMNEMKSRQQASLFVSALNLVRSESITRVDRVTMCKAESPTKCNDDATWNDYWVVFTDSGSESDPGTIGTIDATETVIKVYKGFESGVQIGSGTEVENYVSFVGTGIPKKADASMLDESKSHFTICGLLDGEYHIDAPNSRVVSLSKTGRVSVTKKGYYPEITACLPVDPTP